MAYFFLSAVQHKRQNLDFWVDYPFKAYADLFSRRKELQIISFFLTLFQVEIDLVHPMLQIILHVIGMNIVCSEITSMTNNNTNSHISKRHFLGMSARLLQKA